MENEKPKTEELPIEEAPAAEGSPALDPPPEAHCPCCNGPAIRKGKTILCQFCNASYRFTKEGPKVEELGPFDKLEQRVTALEGGVDEEDHRAELAAQADALGMESLTEDQQIIVDRDIITDDDGI